MNLVDKLTNMATDVLYWTWMPPILMKQKKVVAILSGGLDSTTLLYELYNNPTTKIVGVLSYFYGQKHKKELKCAQKTCKKLKLRHQIVNLSSIKPLLKGSALTDNIVVPEGHYESKNMKLTVVPSRNLIMLSIATAYAISLKAEAVYIGTHRGDHEVYPDCRKEFIDKLSEVTKIANYQPVEIIAPFINDNKTQIVEYGLHLNVPYEDTWTCYNGRKKACGKCGSCQERLEAFKLNNSVDPIEYEK